MCRKVELALPEVREIRCLGWLDDDPVIRVTFLDNATVPPDLIRVRFM